MIVLSEEIQSYYAKFVFPTNNVEAEFEGC